MTTSIAMPVEDLAGIDSRTREQWLQWGVDELRQRFKDAKHELPARVHVSVGWPVRGALSIRKPVIGECWKAEASSDGVNQIFISPILKTGPEALDVLVHELVHVVTPGSAHKRPFVRAGNAVGLTEGKPTSLRAGLELMTELVRLNAQSPYPHAKLSPLLVEKKQSTRLLKASCTKCGYVCRVTQRWIDIGAPWCPSHKEPMKVIGA